jgi:DNA polymerase
MKKIYIDFETRSCADIKTVGAWKYAMDPTTEIMCMAYCGPGDGKVHVIEDIGATLFPEGVEPFIREGAVFVAHSAHFEYAIWNYILHKRFGWPALWEPQRWRCTLAKAAMCNLPLSLDQAGAALNLTVKKDLTGRKAMLALTKPIHIDALDQPTYNEDEELKKVMYEYCRKDVESEMELDARLPDLPPAEQKLWELDLTINHRGVQADTETAAKAMGLASVITTDLNSRLLQLTGGAVTKASQIAEIKRYLALLGAQTPQGLDKTVVAGLLADPSTPQKAKDVVKIRQQVGKSSTAKYEAILDYASPSDGRMRGLLQYHAAGTGRWGGRGPQPQNFPKGVGFDSEKVCVDAASLLAGGFQRVYGDKAMDALSAGLRGVLTAGPGKVLCAADYSAIEARVLFWLAGDELALGKYRMGINLYVDMARFIYNNFELTKKDAVEYAVGKAAVLGCGYGMGKVKFHGTCQSWGIDIDEGMAEAAIKAYRKKYKAVVEMWYKQEDAARNAILNPGSVHPCGKVVWGMDKKREFLVCKLPSGRHLRYFRPSVKPIITPYGEKQEIHYWCNGLGGKLEENKTYGGSLVENITQAVARDIMAHGMINAESAGFPVILTVHDELVTEIPDLKEGPEWQEAELGALVKAMCALPKWANGLPIAAEGWVGKRYRK